MLENVSIKPSPNGMWHWRHALVNEPREEERKSTAIFESQLVGAKQQFMASNNNVEKWL